MSTFRTLTLADAALPRAGVLQNVMLIVGASIVTAMSAQVALPVPWSPVPLTGQTFAVLLTGAVLGPRRAFLAMMLYLAQGAAGLPVFAGGTAGLVKFVGPTGGYLLSFPFAAAVTGMLAERGWDKRFFTMFAAMMLGSAVIFAFGLAVLSQFVPNDMVLGAGFLPFLPGDVVKSSLAALAFPRVWRWVRGRKDRGGIER